MAIHLNSAANPSAIKFNGVDLDKLYFNTVLVWQKSLIINVGNHFSNQSSGAPTIYIGKLIAAYRKHGESIITIRVAKGAIVPSMIMDQHLTGGITKVILENNGEIQDSRRNYGLYVYNFTTLYLINNGAIRGQGGHGGVGGTGHIGKAGGKGGNTAATHKKVAVKTYRWAAWGVTVPIPTGWASLGIDGGWRAQVGPTGAAMNGPCSYAPGTGIHSGWKAVCGCMCRVTINMAAKTYTLGRSAGSWTQYKTVTIPAKTGGAGGGGGRGGTGGVGGTGRYYLHANIAGKGGNGGGVGGVGKPSRPAGGHSGGHGGTGYRGGAGGWGQNWGVKGNKGHVGTGGGSGGGAGGAPGYSIMGNNHCHIIKRGTLSGPAKYT